MWYALGNRGDRCRRHYLVGVADKGGCAGGNRRDDVATHEHVVDEWHAADDTHDPGPGDGKFDSTGRVWQEPELRLQPNGAYWELGRYCEYPGRRPARNHTGGVHHFGERFDRSDGWRHGIDCGTWGDGRFECGGSNGGACFVARPGCREWWREHGDCDRQLHHERVEAATPDPWLLISSIRGRDPKPPYRD
jgi:hypothetical protein